MINRKRFVMHNPFWHFAEYQWFFRLHADSDIIDKLENHPCVVYMHEVEPRAVDVCLNPLYDYEEAWLTIYEWLEYETAAPDPELWGNALLDF